MDLAVAGVLLADVDVILAADAIQDVHHLADVILTVDAIQDVQHHVIAYLLLMQLADVTQVVVFQSKLQIQ